MATNIEREDNLLQVIRNTNITIRDKEKHDNLLSVTDSHLVVVFKDDRGVYPNGKVSRSSEKVTKYNYEYRKDIDDSTITSCVVTKTTSKTGENLYKTIVETTYDVNNRPIKIEHKTKDGIVVKKTMLWYKSDGTITKKTVKGTDGLSTFYFDDRGNNVLITFKTLSSKIVNKVYSATYNDSNEKIHETHYTHNEETSIEIDKDHNGNKLSVTTIHRHLNDNKIFAKESIIYDPETFKVSKVFKKGMLVASNKYDLNGDEVEMLIRESDKEVLTRIYRTIDEETGNKTVEKHIYITDVDDEKSHTKYIKYVYDKDNKLLLYSEDNSKVSSYTYNSDGKRESAITKQLVNDEFIVISKITYSYSMDEETGKQTITRIEERYDKNGNIVSKNINTNSTTDTEEENIHEIRLYEVNKA